MIAQRKRLGLLAAWLAAALGAAPAAADITTSLVLHWALDEGSGSTAGDSTGNGYHGTIGNPSWVGGKIGSNAVLIDDLPTSRVITKTSFLLSYPFTTSLWVYPTTADQAMVVYWQGQPTTSWYGDYIAIGTNRAVSANSVNNNVFRSATSSALVALDEWNHICGVWASGTSRKIYVNGVGPVTNTDSNTQSGFSTTYIGQHGTFGGGAFAQNMVVDDIRLYTRALSDADVAELYAMGGSPPAPTVRRQAIIVGSLRRAAWKQNKYGHHLVWGIAS